MLKIIDCVEEKEHKKDYDKFYYAFKYEKDSFVDMVTSGIKSKDLRLLRPSNYGFNGKYFINLYKLTREYKDNFWYYASNVYKELPKFMIDEDITAYKSAYINNGSDIRLILKNTKIPIRVSNYLDEWQARDIINVDKIKGIIFNIKEIVDTKEERDGFIYLSELYDMIKTMEELGIDLEVIDYSTEKVVNKSKVLKIL